MDGILVAKFCNTDLSLFKVKLAEFLFATSTTWMRRGFEIGTEQCSQGIINQRVMWLILVDKNEFYWLD